MEDRRGPRREGDVELSDAQLDAVAERAAAKVIATVQLEIGRSAIRALLYVVGAAMVAAVAWLTAHGFLKS